MPKARRKSYNLAFKLKIVTKSEAVENNSEIISIIKSNQSKQHRCKNLSLGPHLLDS